MAMRPHEDLFSLGMKLRRVFIDSYSVISQNILKLLANLHKNFGFISQLG